MVRDDGRFAADGSADPARIEAFSRDVRLRSALEDASGEDGRTPDAKTRLEAASRRDALAGDRDRAAAARDATAAARDLAMAQADPAAERAAAAEERRAAARDRANAARDRLLALADREALAAQIARAETDALTGARNRAAGLAELEDELDRARRSGAQLVVAFVDVVGLKALNDSAGHHAGDALLQRAVALIRDQLRCYDLIIRMGGDEFLCVMPDIRLADARERIGRVEVALAGGTGAGGIRTGFAEFDGDEGMAQLIARADCELIGGRRGAGAP